MGQAYHRVFEVVKGSRATTSKLVGFLACFAKQWNSYYVESGGLKSFQALFGALSNLNKEGYTNARISTGIVRQQNFTADVIYLTMSNRKITISIQNELDISNRISVQIDETLSK
jgi:hypothetical protein